MNNFHVVMQSNISTRSECVVQVSRFSVEVLAMVHLAIFSTASGCNPASACGGVEDAAQRSGSSQVLREAKSEVINGLMDYHIEHFNAFVEAWTRHFQTISKEKANMVRHDESEGRGGGSSSKSSLEAEVGNTEEETMMALTAGGGFMGNTAAVFGVQDIEEAVATWRADEWTEMMFKSLRKVQSNEELWKLIDPVPSDPKIKFKWAETMVKESAIPSVKARHEKGLDGGLGLFAHAHIPAMSLVAVLTEGETYTDLSKVPQDEMSEGEVLLMVRRRAGSFSELYQRGAIFLDEEPPKVGDNKIHLGWMANLPERPEECNCVAIAARAGKDQWFSFLLSVKPIEKGEEILSDP